MLTSHVGKLLKNLTQFVVHNSKFVVHILYPLICVIWTRATLQAVERAYLDKWLERIFWLFRVNTLLKK